MRVVVSIGLVLMVASITEAQTPPPAPSPAAVMEWPEWLFPIHPPSLKKAPATPPKLDDV